MSSALPDVGASAIDVAVAPSPGRLWWLWLISGIAWLVAGLVVLQFDQASITTIGLIVGVMFLFAGAQQLVETTYADSMRWLSAIFAGLFLVAGVICFVNPEKTFAGLADILGFLFLTVGVVWTIQAFLGREDNPIWWLGLITGLLMLVMAFWTSGQFFVEKAYVLLVFAGIWALMHGVTDIVRAFHLRRLRDDLSRPRVHAPRQHTALGRDERSRRHLPRRRVDGRRRDLRAPRRGGRGRRRGRVALVCAGGDRRRPARLHRGQARRAVPVLRRSHRVSDRRVRQRSPRRHRIVVGLCRGDRDRRRHGGGVVRQLCHVVVHRR